MKYLKITVISFAICFALASVGVQAKVYAITYFKIPSWSGTAWTDQADKDTLGYHKVKKNECKDSVSGDERAIRGKIMTLFGSGKTSAAKDLPKGVTVKFSDVGTDYGAYKLGLYSVKSLLTTARYYGIWDLGNDLDNA